MRKLFVLLFLLAYSLILTAGADSAACTIGSPAPGLELDDLKGTTVSLQNYLQKKPVIITFFTSWSKSCQSELSDLQEIYDGKSPKAEIIGVAFDKKTSELKNFIAANSLSFPIIADKRLSLIDNFQITIIPTTICINRDGIIEKIFLDYDDNVKKAVLDWLRS